MRANRVRMLWHLRSGDSFWGRGRGHMLWWFQKHGLVEKSERNGWVATEKGRSAAQAAIADYSARGRLPEVFPNGERVTGGGK